MPLHIQLSISVSQFSTQVKARAGCRKIPNPRQGYKETSTTCVYIQIFISFLCFYKFRAPYSSSDKKKKKKKRTARKKIH